MRQSAQLFFCSQTYKYLGKFLKKVSKRGRFQTLKKFQLSSACFFAAKLKDPFPPARIAAINALAATQQYYTIQVLISRISVSDKFLLSEAQPKNAIVNPPPHKKIGNDCQ
jgi:hypothetical protein